MRRDHAQFHMPLPITHGTQRNQYFSTAKLSPTRWRRPNPRTYKVNDDVQNYYYRSVIDHMDDRDNRVDTKPPGFQTYAERLVNYWPGQSPRSKSSGSYGSSSTNRRLRWDEDTISKRHMDRSPSPPRRRVRETNIQELDRSRPRYRDPTRQKAHEALQSIHKEIDTKSQYERSSQCSSKSRRSRRSDDHSISRYTDDEDLYSSRSQLNDLDDSESALYNKYLRDDEDLLSQQHRSRDRRFADENIELQPQHHRSRDRHLPDDDIELTPRHHYSRERRLPVETDYTIPSTRVHRVPSEYDDVESTWSTVHPSSNRSGHSSCTRANNTSPTTVHSPSHRSVSASAEARYRHALKPSTILPEAPPEDDFQSKYVRPGEQYTSKYYYPIHRANLVKRDHDHTVDRFKSNTVSSRYSDKDPFNTYTSASSLRAQDRVSPHRSPMRKTYNYNYDVETNYYKPLLDRRQDQRKGRASSPLRSQTYAERCVKYWPGMTQTRSWSNENNRRRESPHSSYHPTTKCYRGAADRPIMQHERNFPGNVMYSYDAYVPKNRTISSDPDLEYLTKKFRNI